LLLNTKSIIDCNEEEYEEHIQELTDIEELICELPNYDCAVILKYLDPAHEKREEKVRNCSLHDFMEMVQYADIKNGVDIEIGDNNIFNLVCYGETYTINDIIYSVKTCISIMPYDENKDFLDLSQFLLNNNSIEMFLN
jgi:hypothetical protein